MEGVVNSMASESLINFILEDLKGNTTLENEDAWENLRECCRNICTHLGIWHGTAPLASLWICITKAQLGNGSRLSLEEVVNLKIDQGGMAPAKHNSGFMSLRMNFKNCSLDRMREVQLSHNKMLRVLNQLQGSPDSILIESCVLIAEDVMSIIKSI